MRHIGSTILRENDTSRQDRAITRANCQRVYTFYPLHDTRSLFALFRVTAKLSIISTTTGRAVSIAAHPQRRTSPAASFACVSGRINRSNSPESHRAPARAVHGQIPASSMATGELGWWENLHIPSSGSPWCCHLTVARHPTLIFTHLDRIVAYWTANYLANSMIRHRIK